MIVMELMKIMQTAVVLHKCPPEKVQTGIVMLAKNINSQMVDNQVEAVVTHINDPEVVDCYKFVQIFLNDHDQALEQQLGQIFFQKKENSLVRATKIFLSFFLSYRSNVSVSKRNQGSNTEYLSKMLYFNRYILFLYNFVLHMQLFCLLLYIA